MNCPSPGRYAAWVSLLGMLITPVLSAEETRSQGDDRSVPSVDVMLDEQMQLAGQVLTPAGDPVEGMEVTLIRDGAKPSRISTDKTGKFRVRLARAGVYQLVVDGQLTTVRAWTPAAAPPSCATNLVVVRGDVLRGQSGQIPFTKVNPWLVAGVVAAAVAIPIVISNHRSDRGDGS